IRTRILDAARELFISEGYDAVTMRKIAERIEYSPTAIYFHFKDKETLMGELCAVDFYTLAQQFTKIARVEDPVERLRRIGHAYAEFAAEFPNHYRLMFMTPRPQTPIPDEIMQRRDNPEEDAYAFLKATIADAIEQKRLRPEFTDVELVSQTMWAGVHGVVSLSIAKANDPWVEWRPLRKRVTIMIDILVDGLTRPKRSK